MTKSRFITRWFGAGVGLLLLTPATLAASAASPKRVLVLNLFGRDTAPFGTATSAFRTTLARELGEPLDFCKVPPVLVRWGDQDLEAATTSHGFRWLSPAPSYATRTQSGE